MYLTLAERRKERVEMKRRAIEKYRMLRALEELQDIKDYERYCNIFIANFPWQYQNVPVLASSTAIMCDLINNAVMMGRSDIVKFLLSHNVIAVNRLWESMNFDAIRELKQFTALRLIIDRFSDAKLQYELITHFEENIDALIWIIINYLDDHIFSKLKWRIIIGFVGTDSEDRSWAYRLWKTIINTVGYDGIVKYLNDGFGGRLKDYNNKILWREYHKIVDISERIAYIRDEYIHKSVKLIKLPRSLICG